MKDKYKNTWMHPRSKHWHLLDYIITRSNKKKDVKRCRVMRSAHCDTDHRLVRAEIQLKPKAFPSKVKPTIRYDSRCLQKESTRQHFQQCLRSKQPNTNPNNNIQTI